MANIHSDVIVVVHKAGQYSSSISTENVTYEKLQSFTYEKLQNFTYEELQNLRR